jgi:Leucine-rich repeat (LRR) protein
VFFLLVLMNANLSSKMETNTQECKEKVILEADDNLVKGIVSLAGCSELRQLTLQISDNKKSWVVFSRIDSIADNQASYSFQKKLEYIPNEVGNLVQLESLDISYLGLKVFPANFDKLVNLVSLNISFNKIDLTNITELLKTLPNLRELKIYGINLNSEFLNKIRENRPLLKILNSEQDFIEEVKKRQQESTQVN